MCNYISSCRAPYHYGLLHHHRQLPPPSPHATLSHCTVAPLPQISLNASFPRCRYTIGASSSWLSSQGQARLRVAQVLVVRTIAKTCRYRFTSIIGLIMQNPPTRSVISAVSTLEHCTAHTPETSQDRRTVHRANSHHLHFPCTIACSLDLLSHLSRLQSRPRHIQNPTIISVLFMSRSRSRSPSLMPYDLVVERLVPTSPIFPLPLPFLVPISTSAPLVVRSAQPEHPSILCLTLFRRRLASRLWFWLWSRFYSSCFLYPFSVSISLT